VVVVLLVCAPPAWAFSVTVTKTADTEDGNCQPTDCSLREAVNDTGADTIVLPAKASHYKVSDSFGGQIQIVRQLTIKGAGATKTIIDASGGTQHRAFDLAAFLNSTSKTVTFQDLTIAGGHTTDAPGGGGIYVEPSGPRLSLVRSVVSGNSANLTVSNPDNGGGGIFNDSGAGTTLTGSTLSGNMAIISSTAHVCCGGGGGIYSDAGPIAVAAGSHVDGNSAITSGPETSGPGFDCCDGGGGIYQDSAATRITDSTVDDNAADVNHVGNAHGGGGIMLDTGGGNLTVLRSSVSGNSVSTHGGATSSGGGGVLEDTGISQNSFVNSTFSDDLASGTGANRGGGALFVLRAKGATDNFANVTIAGNSASSGRGGGIFVAGSAIRTKDSIVSLNSASGGGANCRGFAFNNGAVSLAPGSFTSLGHNLEDAPDTCHFTGAGDKVLPAGSLGLGPLANSGGPGRTRALLVGSPAIDAGDPAGCKDFAGHLLTTDQRGALRPFGLACDIGSFENQSPPQDSELKVKPRKFRAATKGPTIREAKKKKKRVGTTVSYRDSRAAVTSFTVFRRKRGVKKGHLCVKPPKKKHGKKRKRCARFVRVGGFTDQDVAGPNRFRFRGRLNGRRLRPGRYRLEAVPSVTGVVGNTVRASFRIVR